VCAPWTQVLLRPDRVTLDSFALRSLVVTSGETPRAESNGIRPSEKRLRRYSSAVRYRITVLFFGAFLFAGSQDRWPFGTWKRVSNDPVLTPQGDGWESAGAFNPAVVVHDGRIVMLYRAQDRNGTSRLGYATSADGIRFTRRPEPVLSPETDYERGGGIEDPRLVKIDDTYYLTYTGYNKKDAQLCLATSTDLVHWNRKGVILPAYKGRWNVGWTKAGAIVPEKIDGKYWMYFLGTAADKTDQMGVAYSDDLVHWTEALDTPVLPRRPGLFDSRVVEPGPPPIVIDDSIAMIYNGADDDLIYRTGLVRFDRKDPRRVLSRTDTPVFVPEREWEKVGQVPNVVFVEGMVRQGNRWLFYYGGADKYVGVADAAAQW
jgi:beta-1,2-mannosidase